MRSGCFEFEPLADEPDDLCERAGSEPEGTLDDARLVERAFGLGACVLTEAIEMLREQLETA